MAIGKVEVIRSDIRRRDLRFIIAAVEGYAGKIFEGGISSLPLAIGQYGLGSRKAASKELASKAELFVESLQEFLSQHLPPNDWNVIIGGTIGFAIRGKHQATAVLRMRENNALASPRKSCVLLICRAPSVVGEIPKWLTDARDKRLIEIDSNTKNSEQMRRHSSFEGEDQKTDDGYSISKTQQNFDDRKIIEEILSEKQGESEEKENSLKRSLEKRNTLVKTHIRSFHATGNPRIDIAAKDSISVCPAVITEWGFLQLSLSTQQERLLRVFERAAIRCQPNQQDNIQLLAQSLRDELMVMSGPLWHVCVARDDIHVKTGTIYIYIC